MRDEDFEFLYALEERYWWFVAMRQITDAIVGAQLAGRNLRILDAGCGTGYNLHHYKDQGHSVFGFDIAPEAVDATHRRGFTSITHASVTDIPHPNDVFDFVFSFDVLSHTSSQSHDKAIAEMRRVLKPGGLLFVRVAAFEWLRSSHDAAIHTLHRFTLGELRQKLTLGGFKIRRTTYANSLLFPVVAIRRLFKHVGIGTGTDVKPLPSGLGWIDPIFRSLLASEAALLRLNGRFPFGVSAIVYAEKPN
jgi:SAM-dependent methyltransferase